MRLRSMKIYAALFAGLLAALAAGCRRDAAAYQYGSVLVNGWESGDTVVLRVPPLEQGGAYAMQLGLRTSNTVSYPFRELWLSVKQEWASGQTIIDTLQCTLATPAGDASGKGVSLNQYEFALPVRQLAKGDSARICINHIMRQDLLLGITDVGIRLEAKEDE
ncbi:MAG: gliding motility lipoprotein GldH [Bacteroidales bacterium]|nr:gliding motility lipoprotein GldH [Bacteroidales bacterium]